MNFQKIIILTILLGLIVPAVGAAGPGRIILSGGADWLVANGTDSAEITVQVLDEGGALLANRTVALDVDPIYGRLAPATVTTGASGTAVTTFTVNKTSGVAVITARAGAVEETLSLSIDHDLPSRIVYLHYDSEVTAGNTTTITVGVADRHGNPVDDRRVAETVRFSAGSVDDDAVFIDDGGSPVPVLERSTNVTGFVRAEFRTGRTVGENIVRMTVLPAGVDRYISIRGLPTGLPAGIDISVSPDADPFPYQPANGESTFTLTCRLFDAWGNPAAGRALQVGTSLGETHTLTTNGTGIACLTYGPKDSTGRIVITATAVDNTSVTASQTVEFIHTDPVEMLLSASPQSMPSRDLRGDITSELQAKVIDIKGNPVAGETVTFTIDTATLALGGSTSTEAPCLERAGKNVATATTDKEGYAVVRFIPGKFARPKVGEQVTAKGTVTVRATWEDISRDILLTWVNYPYLSVETSVSNQTIAVNDTTNVTVRLKGDGYALRPNPIDVVLVMDRSGSMRGQRIADAKSAAQIFVSMMDSSRDRIGLVSYSNGATLNQPLGKNYSKVTKAIKDLEASGYTATREALHIGIQEMVAKKSSDPDVVRAVILMSDGEYNYYGDPLARGTGSDSHIWTGARTDTYTYFSDLGGSRRDGGGLRTNQNMSVYAKNNGVRLYMISFSNDITPENTTWKTMDTLAEITGGKHYHAPTGTDLARVYADIAGELKTEAGIDTAMTILENVEMSSDQVLGDSILIPAYEVFTYVHDATRSTYIHNQTQTDNPAEPKVLFDGTIDQLNDWKNNRKLSFNIGTIRLNQTWEATFRLAVNSSYRGGENNNINIFGDGAKVTFNNGEDATHADTLSLPDTFITIFPDLTNEGITSAFLDVEFTGQMLGPGPYVDLVPLSWATTYNGTQGVDLFLTCSRYEDMRSPATFFTQTLDCTKFSTEDNTTTNSTLMDVRGLPPGEYWVTVTASARDARTAEDTTSLWAHTTDSSCSHIRIE